MNEAPPPQAQRTLILAPLGRDAVVAKSILREAALRSDICLDLDELVDEIKRGADTIVLTEESLRNADTRRLAEWVALQPPWSDLPFILLTGHGGGIERNPAAARQTETLGNVTFLERPFHPTTLVSVVRTALRGRQRQYECRRLNEELEYRVAERTKELAAANRQLLAQIEERERVESTLRQMQRLEAVGQLTSGVAHDFNNLLTVVLGNITFLEKTFAAAEIDGSIAKRLSYMRAAAERGAKLTDQLLTFSRRQRLEPKSVDLNSALAAMQGLLQSTLGGSVQIETSFLDGLWPALVDPTQLELAVLNLAINARDAMHVGGRLRLETRNVSLAAPSAVEDPPAGDYVEIAVRDNGAGMTEEVRRKVFEPFFTTKEVGKGSGLGLSQVLGFAKQSGGGVRIETAAGRGTSVCIYLPRSQTQSVSASAAAVREAGRQRAGAHVLLVDDDNAVREVTAAMLRSLGYVVSEAGSGGAALEMLDSIEDIALVMVDFAMPGMNGAELARQGQARRPRLPVLFITGFAERLTLGGITDDQIVGKPFTEQELAQKVRAALNGSPAENVVPFGPPQRVFSR